MDIMIDTNVIISAALFPNPRMNYFLSLVSEQNNLFLCTYSLEEVEQVIERKFPAKKRDMAIFLQKLRYELIYTPSVGILGRLSARDPNDNKILASAIIADVDVLITGDKDFEGLNIERPEIMSISQFLELFR